MEKLVTIGVAVYNVEKFLPSCLNSIISQNNDNIEVIIVDDGSEDLSGKICDEYAEKDSRIKVVHKANGGVSSARNVVIDSASGKWICFIDGDDMLRKGSFGTVYKYADDKFDSIYFDLSYFRVDDSIPDYMIKAEPLKISGQDIDKLRLATVYTTAEDNKKFINKTIKTSCGKLYKTSFLRDNDLHFNTKVAIAEDQLFNFCCLGYAKNIELVRKSVMLYRNSGMSTTKSYNPHIIKQNFIMLENFTGEIKKAEDDNEEMLSRLRCLELMALKTDFINNVFHENNREAKDILEAKFSELIACKRFADAVKNCNIKILHDDDKKFLVLLRTKDRKAMAKYFKNKSRNERYKVFANKIGIAKFLKKILRKH